MPINIQISIDLTPRQKRMIRSACVAGSVVGALGVGVVVAAPKNTFTAGTIVSASKMNENFADLDTRLSTAVQRLDGMERVVRVRFGGTTENISAGCTVTSCTIYRQSGSIESVTRLQPGDYLVTFASGTFGSPPSCTCSSNQPGVFGGGICGSANANTSATTFEVVTSSRTGTLADSQVDVVCISSS